MNVSLSRDLQQITRHIKQSMAVRATVWAAGAITCVHVLMSGHACMHVRALE